MSTLPTVECSDVEPLPCLGLYCGRVFLNGTSPNGSCYSDCGACPSASRVGNESSECVPCSTEALQRDYLFLAFVCLVCVGVRLACLAIANIGRTAYIAKLIVMVMAFAENGLALVLTLLLLLPHGTFSFNTCSVSEVSDFYPIFYDPTYDYVHHVHCSYEVAYPRNQMVFIFLSFSLLLHLLLLFVVPVMVRLKSTLNPLTEFSWLVAFPIIALLFAIFTGLLYFVFEYLTLIMSIGSFLIVTTVIQLTKYGFKNTFKVYTSAEYWVFAVICMLYFGFGIISLTDFATIEFRVKFLPLILSPIAVHPILSYFASPKHHLESWGIESYTDFYDY